MEKLTATRQTAATQRLWSNVHRSTITSSLPRKDIPQAEQAQLLQRQADRLLLFPAGGAECHALIIGRSHPRGGLFEINDLRHMPVLTSGGLWKDLTIVDDYHRDREAKLLATGRHASVDSGNAYGLAPPSGPANHVQRGDRASVFPPRAIC